MRLWRTGFIEPVRGKRTGIFGSMRIMNGQPRNPHSGEDIGAPSGTPVIASNDGIVRVTVDHIFSGRGIYVDHGLGLYSMYFHLSEILVRDGDLVMIRSGYHPFVAAYGYHAYYLNTLAGSARSMAASDDPRYAHLRSTWPPPDPRVPLIPHPQ